MRRNVIGAVVITILVLGALGAAAFGVYQVGYHQGLVETGTVVVNRVGPGFHPGHWGFAGFWGFGLIFKFLFLFLIIGLIARLFFGRRHWGPGPYWAKDWHEGHTSPMEQRLADWHEKAHGDPSAKPDSDQDA